MTYNLLEMIKNIFHCNKQCPDTDYMVKRIETLSDELALCLGAIDLIEETQTLVDPYDVLNDYDVIAADIQYLTYNIEDWKSIIFRLHKHLGDKFHYKCEVADCDDFALLYTSIMVYSAYHTGLSKQPALGIAWSYNHAFNVVIDNNNTVWIVEPQDGDIISRIQDNITDVYDIKKIWFLS